MGRWDRGWIERRKGFLCPLRVEHEVKMMDFTEWLERKSGSPREMCDRHRIRSILGMPAPP